MLASGRIYRRVRVQGFCSSGHELKASILNTVRRYTRHHATGDTNLMQIELRKWGTLMA